MTNSATAGQTFSSEIRSMMKIGSRTRWNRKNPLGDKLTRDAMIERVWTSLNHRGYDNEQRTAIFATAHTALCAYAKFIDGFRIDGMLRFQILDLTPREFTAFLGRMIDSGCTNMGEFEQWFRSESVAA